MFTNPQISSELARDRQREMLTNAEQQRVARQLLAHRKASSRADHTDRRVRHALRAAFRLSPDSQA